MAYPEGEGFHKNQAYCKTCQKTYAKKRYLGRKDEINKRTTEYRRRPEVKIRLWVQRHNLTVDQVEAIWEAQNHRCAICEKAISLYMEDGRKVDGAHIDHDHKCCPERKGRHYSCGKCVRGLLCMNCNHMLGSALENPDTLREAVHYLTSGIIYH